MGGERDRVEPVIDSDLLSDVVIRITLKMVTRWNNALGKSPLHIPCIITYTQRDDLSTTNSINNVLLFYIKS